MTEEKFSKVSKLLTWLAVLAGLCSLTIFIPQFRIIIIRLIENRLQMKFDTPHFWNKINEMISALGLIFLVSLCLFVVLMKLYGKILKSKLDAYSFFDNRLKKISTDEWLHFIPLVFFVLVLCIVHFCIAESGDDIFFKQALDGSLFSFLKGRYSTWTSRLVIEAALVNSYKFHFGVWRFFDVAAFVLIAECMIAICLPKKRYASLVYAVILFFTDWYSLQTAGWGATTVNYLWPLACAMPFFVVTKTVLENKSVSKLKITLSLLLLVFAVNHEQIVALLLGFSVSFLAMHFVQSKKIQKSDIYFLAVILLCAASLVFTLTCPGNTTRFSKGDVWFPEYQTVSFSEKLQLGIMTIFTYYFAKFGVLTMIPLCLILTCWFYKTNRIKYFVQLVLDLYIVLSVLAGFVKTDFLLVNDKLAKFSVHSEIAVLVECGVLLIIGAVFLHQIIFVMSDKLQGLLNAFLLFAGFCSAFIIAFSPTVYASGARCYLFMSYAIFAVVFRIFYDTYGKRSIA